MAGGTFTVFNKKQAGVYFDVKVEERQNEKQAPSGIVAYPFTSAKWGERNKIIELNSINECFDKLGYYASSPEMRRFVEMFRGTNKTDGANQVYVIIPNTDGQAKASITSNQLTIEATNYGTRGNDLTYVATPDFSTEYEEGKYAVYKINILLDGVVISSQTCGSFIDTEHYEVAQYKDLKNNNFVNYIYEDETEEIFATAGLNLEGGISNEATVAETSTILDVLDGKFFNVLCYDGNSQVLKEAFENFVIRQWETRGYPCQLMTSNYKPNSELAISNSNGIKLSDGYVLDDMKYTWWYAGCSAGAKYYESLTHKQHPMAVDITKEYTIQELDDLIDEGQIVNIKEFNQVMINKDINTLTTYTPDKSKALSANRSIRTINEICNYCNYQFNLNYIGDIPNNANGRDLIKGNVIAKLREMEGNGAISNVETSDVEVYEIVEDIEAVYMTIAILLVGAIEKIYIRIMAR